MDVLSLLMKFKLGSLYQIAIFFATEPTEMGPTEVRDFCKMDASGEKLLKAAMHQLHLSARAYHCVLKFARTIADLAQSEVIVTNHGGDSV
jgi:magnesium chelatase family protein